MTAILKDTHSQFVRFIKIGFPVLAGILIIGVFVFNKTNPVRDSAIISGPELAKLAIGQKIINPHYSGVTKTGDAFSISAESALPNAPLLDRVDLVAPNTTISFVDGLEVRTTSKTGQLDINTQEATLTGSVYLQTSDHYQAYSEKVIMNFRTGNANSPGPVRATGPMGRITAGNMELTQNLDQAHPKSKAILRFGKGVKLVYYPTDIKD